VKRLLPILIVFGTLGAPARADRSKAVLDGKPALRPEPALKLARELWDVDGELFVESKDAPRAENKGARTREESHQLSPKNK
jgi:hypothetical protein